MLFRFPAVLSSVMALVLATGGSSPLHAADQPVIEPTWFEFVDGVFAKAEYIDINLKTQERLYIRYGPISDSGVELELTKGTTVCWRVHVQPLGVSHSRYFHQVTVMRMPLWENEIDPAEIHVVSVGRKTIYETRSLIDGRQISRMIKENAK